MVLVQWLIAAIAFLLAAYLLPGFKVDGLVPALIGAAALGLANMIVKPILLFFSLPITILTLGLFLLVINGLMLWLVAAVVPGVSVTHFGWAILAALVIALVNAIFGGLTRA